VNASTRTYAHIERLLMPMASGWEQAVGGARYGASKAVATAVTRGAGSRRWDLARLPSRSGGDIETAGVGARVIRKRTVRGPPPGTSWSRVPTAHDSSGLFSAICVKTQRLREHHSGILPASVRLRSGFASRVCSQGIRVLDSTPRSHTMTIRVGIRGPAYCF